MGVLTIRQCFPQKIKKRKQNKSPKERLSFFLLHLLCCISRQNFSKVYEMQHLTPFFSGKKKLQMTWSWECGYRLTRAHIHSQTAEKPSPPLDGTQTVPHGKGTPKVGWRLRLLSISSKGQVAFFNKAPQLNPVPPPSQTSHSTQHQPKDRKS